MEKIVISERNGIILEQLDANIYRIDPTFINVEQPCDEKTLCKIKKDTEELWQKETGLKLIYAYYEYIEDPRFENVKRLLPVYYFVNKE